MATNFNKHLLWAYICWNEENNNKPHVAIAERNIKDESLLPMVKQGFLSLNLSGSAIRELKLEENHFSFKTRFGGVEKFISCNYVDIVGVTSPVEYAMLPLNVVPLMLTEGLGFMIQFPDNEPGPRVGSIEKVEENNITKKDNVVNLFKK